ncbi:hypothetical protein KGF56_003304 [Candida oxycetoniae]|uniref:TEL2-interacting protein 1 n=1 Tax=Candida oxycetoniae TaxID=497107 RepID=A0AAI9SW03_9ASCO|nr:uncharacterized protein KGF56_003304 [Candida oxycetoniae]KAI3403874.2 hypothetical protein KGF56_003304 [Candida oxycetoniae]
MSVDTSISSSTVERTCSLELFELIKPVCIELSRETLTHSAQAPLNEHRVIALLISIETSAQSLYEEYCKSEKPFILLPNVADYIFFPISNLLRRPKLASSITQHLLVLIAYLTKHCWRYNVNYALFDQLYPLVLLLTGEGGEKGRGKGDVEKEATAITCQSLQFKAVSIRVLMSFITALDSNYFQESEKRLYFLTNTISLALDVVTSTRASDQEAISMLSETFKLVSTSLKLLSAEKQSMIVPGVVSALTTFSTMNSSHNYKLMAQVLYLLSTIISTSFNDEDLGAKLNMDQKLKISDLDADEDENLMSNVVQISKFKAGGPRTMSWLRATSKQLKIMLVIFFKSIILSPKNKESFKSKIELYESVVFFITSILKNCFVSLYYEVTPIIPDICSILVCASSYNETDENSKVWQIANTVKEAFSGDSQKSTAFYEMVKAKLESLIENKLSLITFSTNEEKIALSMISIKLYFAMLSKLSKEHEFEDNALSNTLELDNLKARCLKILLQFTTDRVKFESTKKNKYAVSEALESNHLDVIKLPAYINAKNVKKQDTSQIDDNGDLKLAAHSLQLLARQLKNFSMDTEKEGTCIDFKSEFLEKHLKSLIQFLSRVKNFSIDGTLSVLEEILDDANVNDTLYSGVAMWFASTYSKNILSEHRYLDVSVFLDIPNMDINESTVSEIAYLILYKAEELLSTRNGQLGYKTEQQLANDTAYISALDAIGTVAGSISLDQFRSDVLMNYLLTILQALTLTTKPNIQEQAQRTMKAIFDTYYEGSMIHMIMDNSDYLIDGISLQMAMGSNLNPALPGILMIVIKVAGIQLLESNQLTDILSDIFVLLDSYHTFNQISESYFLVFEALVDQIKQMYMIEEKRMIEHQDVNNSQFHPWGMHNKEQMVAFINGDRVVDAYSGYESGKEYFKRTEDKPFSEMTVDSDDEMEEEEEEGEGEQEREEEKWISPISKDVYAVLKRIFNYGLVLVSQPSYSLKSQIIKTLRMVYPLLCTDYKLVLPIVTTHWPMLIALITGSNSLATFSVINNVNNNNFFPHKKVKVTVEALQFVTEILQQDNAQGDYFFGTKFQEAIDFMLKNSDLAQKKPSKVIKGITR